MSLLQRLHSVSGKFSPQLARLADLGARLQVSGKPCLLLCWDLCGLHAALAEGGGAHTRGAQIRLLGQAFSGEGHLRAALAAVLEQLAAQGLAKPQQAILAARQVLPLVADLPVLPGKPRPRAQMRELVQAELEPALAEFGGLWTMGALMQARGHIDAAGRQRIVQEDEIRRQNRQSQLRFSEIALELGLLDRAAVDECLDQQAVLQHLESRFAAGWLGRMEERQPLWLACGVSERSHQEWREICDEAGLRLAATLPLAWLASADEPPPANSEHGRDASLPQVTLEIHLEEVIAICRRHGQVVAARSEGRVERALAADWLTRLIADWVGEPRLNLEIRALHADDDTAIAALADDLTLVTGHTCRVLGSGDSRAALWRNLLREGSSRTPGLPRLVDKEMRGSVWNNHDLRRLAVLAVVLLAVGGYETIQRQRLHHLETRMSERQQQEQARSLSAQQMAQVNQQLEHLGQSLDQTRRQLAPLLADRTRLDTLLSMQADLPELLYMLAQSIGNDAVLDEVHNDVTRASGATVHVRAWSPSYTGAQAFVSRVAAAVRNRAWGVAQTEINERAGRDGKRGHEIGFWLLPEEGELEPTAPADPAAARLEPTP